MARYTGPKTRIARKFGEPIFGPDKHLDRKNFPPGQHGVNKKRKKTSEYGVQLREKQKAKYTYGMLERQFRNTFEKASRSKGVTGEVLLQLNDLVQDISYTKSEINTSIFQLTTSINTKPDNLSSKSLSKIKGGRKSPFSLRVTIPTQTLTLYEGR